MPEESSLEMPSSPIWVDFCAIGFVAAGAWAISDGAVFIGLLGIAFSGGAECVLIHRRIRRRRLVLSDQAIEIREFRHRKRASIPYDNIVNAGIYEDEEVYLVGVSVRDKHDPETTWPRLSVLRDLEGEGWSFVIDSGTWDADELVTKIRLRLPRQ